MEKVSGIYRIVCVKNGNYYYGSAKNITYRWYKHRYCLRHNIHINSWVQHTWNKYGEESFRVEITELVPEEKLFEVEDKYLKEHVGKPHCMNISNDAHTPTLTPSIRKKISLASKRQWKTQDKVAIMKKVKIGLKKYWDNPAMHENARVREQLYNQQHPERAKNHSAFMKKYCSTTEFKEKMKKSTTNYFADPENRKKQSERKKKYFASEENRKAQSKRIKAYHKAHPEARKKHSDFMKKYNAARKENRL